MEGAKSLAQNYDFNNMNLMIKEYLQTKIQQEGLANGANCQAALGYGKILKAFEKEEKVKKGTHIISKYSEFQLNKVPAKKEELGKFPKLYQAFVDDENYQRALTQSKHNPQPQDQSKIDIEPALTEKEKKLSYQHSIL